MKLDYDPVVDVRAIKPKNKQKSDIQSAIDETAKYPVIDTDFMTDDKDGYSIVTMWNWERKNYFIK